MKFLYAEAVQAAAFRADVVLLDIGLPKLNGFDICRRIREQPWGKDMVLVALTGWGYIPLSHHSAPGLGEPSRAIAR